MTDTLKAVVVREGDARTTIIEFPEPIGVIDRHDPDMDWMTDEQTISLTVLHHTGRVVEHIEAAESDDSRIRYIVELAPQ